MAPAQDAHPFAFGQHKVAYRGRFGDEPVVVKRARKSTSSHTWTPEANFALFRDEAFLFTALNAQESDDIDRKTLLDARGKVNRHSPSPTHTPRARPASSRSLSLTLSLSPLSFTVLVGRYALAPRLLGFCLDAGSLSTVVETAQTLEELRRQDQWTLAHRVDVAVGLLNLLTYLEHDGPLGPLVHCDIHHNQLAFVRGRPVLLDLDGLQRAPFARARACDEAGIGGVADERDTPVCERHCFKEWHYVSFLEEAAGSVRLDERQCDASTNFCHGYTAAFNKWTIGAYLMWETLLRYAPSHVSRRTRVCRRRAQQRDRRARPNRFLAA